jgi:ATP-dependent Clp protease ATP-binding subunit ClpA
MKTNDFREILAANLIGQEHAIEALMPPIVRWNAGFNFGNRPAGIYLLLGPTGSGKTHSVEAVAKALHGSEAFVLTVHCGEYHLDHETAKLVGAPPGYLGHKETNPILSQQAISAKASPNCNLTVILFDEIEKASPSLYRLLLGVLDKGELRTGDNKLTSFKNTLIFFTSNLGSQELKSTSYTFDKREVEQKQKVGIAENAARNHFAPEFRGRLDAIITYNHLGQEQLREIIGTMAARANADFEKVGGNGRIKLAVSDEAKDWLISRYFSKEYGARELRRGWENEVILPLAHYVNACEGTSRMWSNLRVECAGDRLEFRPIGLEESLAESLLLVPKREISIFGKVRGKGK